MNILTVFNGKCLSVKVKNCACGAQTENLLNLIGFNLHEATPAINVQQKTLCRSKTTTNHDHFASGARSDGNNNLTFLV